MQTQTQSIACTSYVLYGGSNGCVLRKMRKAINQRGMEQLSINFPDTRNTFADFFSGAGGISLGFIKAGLKCISAMELNSDAAWTYWTNLCYKGWSHLWIDPDDEKTIKKVKKWGTGETQNVHWKNGVPDNWLTVEEPMPCLNLFLMDIMKIEPEDWMHLCGVRPGDIRTFVGGPPCQGFSMAGTRDMYDKRNQLPLRMIYYAKVCKPEFVLIENVPGLISLGRKEGEKEGPFVHWIREAFNDAGYHMRWEIHNTADYGVPQNRRRVIFFAVRKDKPMPERIITPDMAVKQYVTVMEAIGHYPPIKHGTSYQGEPYSYENREGYVICPNCLQYNAENRKNCHNCDVELSKPIRGGVYHYHGMTMIKMDKK